MPTNNYFTATGTENNIERNMVDTITYNKANADLLFNLLNENQDLLSDDECFTIDKNENNNDAPNNSSLLGFMLDHQKYHINIKFATLALLCLLFDIEFSKGFAAFLFGVFGLNYAVTKLDGIEKCIAYRLRKEKALSLDELKQPCRCSFSHYNSKCGNLSDNGTCAEWEKEDLVEETINSLMDKKVIKQKGDKYVLVF